MAERAVWLTIYDLAKPHFTTEDETVSALLNRHIDPLLVRHEHVQENITILDSKYKSRIANMGNFTKLLYKAANAAGQRLTVDEINIQCAGLSENELAFLSTIYDRVLNYDDLPNHLLLDFVRTNISGSEYDLLMQLCVSDLQLTAEAVDGLAVYLPVKHIIDGHKTSGKKGSRIKSFQEDFRDQNAKVPSEHSIRN